MGNMSYCRFENTARDLVDCVNAIRRGEIHELNNYELDGLKDILDLAEQIVEDKEYIQEIINNDRDTKNRGDNKGYFSRILWYYAKSGYRNAKVAICSQPSKKNI